MVSLIDLKLNIKQSLGLNVISTVSVLGNQVSGINTFTSVFFDSPTDTDRVITSILTPEEKEDAHNALLEAYKAEVSDRESARSREVEVAKAGGKDWLFNITGLVGLGAFGVIIWAILALDIPETNKELFYHLIGIVEGVSLSIFGYYFGTSMKDDKK